MLPVQPLRCSFSGSSPLLLQQGEEHFSAPKSADDHRCALALGFDSAVRGARKKRNSKGEKPKASPLKR